MTGCRDKECFAGHANFAIPSGHPSGDVGEMAGLSGPRERWGWSYKWKVISMETVFKAEGVDEITQSSFSN